MRRLLTYIFICYMWKIPLCVSGYTAPVPPFSPPAGDSGSTAVHYTDASITGWATNVVEVIFGDEVSDDGNWKDPQSALGPATGSADSGLLVLGRGGQVTLEFESGIADGDGFDFVVFENAFSESFLELAYVEVSSDGNNFVRIPAYSLTLEPVGTWGNVSATLVDGMAGKYQAGYGTPFDLAVLREAYQGVVNGYGGFSDQYENLIVTAYPLVDLQAIRFVRIVDIVGDGTYLDCEGYPVYDPYPTFLTAGFDLDAIAVINPALPGTTPFAEWAAALNLSGDPEADSDGDKWKDLLEYQFATDPLDPDNVPGFRVDRAGGQDSLSLSYDLNARAASQPEMYYSSDGALWQPLPPGAATKPGPGTLVWKDDIPFFRISVEISAIPQPGFFQFRSSASGPGTG